MTFKQQETATSVNRPTALSQQCFLFKVHLKQTHKKKAIKMKRS